MWPLYHKAHHTAFTGYLTKCHYPKQDAMGMEHTEIALFPIPGMVAFPGTTVPLHVFEPRYRRMINECVEEERLLGVCHTSKTLNQGPSKQTIEEALNTNQATHQPHVVFSAGQCEVKEVLDDGRMLVLLAVLDRYRLVTETQTLPYRIGLCERLADIDTDDPDESAELQARLVARLLEIAQGQDSAELLVQLKERIESLTPSEFSFQLFEFVRFDADLMQEVLENTSPNGRLRLIAQVLQAG